MSKTVYILGAGFSSTVGAPSQAKILEEIFNLDLGMLSGQEATLYESSLKLFEKFLNKTLFVSRLCEISLENIFTPIDRCILDNVSFRSHSQTSLLKIRKAINFLIVVMLHYKLKNVFDDAVYIKRFSQYIINLRKKGKDPTSIISTNWDIIIDKGIFRLIDKRKQMVDYCCYIKPYYGHERLESGLYAKGQGKQNIKILKLHGSMNWLQCKRCLRLFISFDEKIAHHEFLIKPFCRLCKENFHERVKDKHYLTSPLIMPTFLKDLNNVQLKLIWQNAGVELAEATKIVFIGYSFPFADFEFRQLLARNVRANVDINVILYKDDEKVKNTIYELSAEYRYKTFFGNRNVIVEYYGFNEYVERFC